MGLDLVDDKEIDSSSVSCTDTMNPKAVQEDRQSGAPKGPVTTWHVPKEIQTERRSKNTTWSKTEKTVAKPITTGSSQVQTVDKTCNNNNNNNKL